ncbi:MAG: hypothetical protein K1X72_04260 [Pyrinomonadaceae bacterium]|nr:hypothetical protein [Pyrinomonadaceae bacterium]
MNEQSAQTKETNTPEAEQFASIIYDGQTMQEWKYSLPVGDKFIDGVIRFHPFKDDRYLEFVSEVSKFNSDIELENVKKAWETNQKLWDDLRISGEFDGIQNWEDYLEFEDISNILAKLTVVVIKSVIKNPDKTITVTTQAYFNGKPCEQIHHLKAKTIDTSSKYSLLESKEYTREEGKGLDAKPIIQFHPQDTAKSEIYEEMLIESKGFGSWTPVRFKTLVIDRIHSSKVKIKK